MFSLFIQYLKPEKPMRNASYLGLTIWQNRRTIWITVQEIVKQLASQNNETENTLETYKYKITIII